MKRPNCTPASMIKKVFRSGERSLPRNEVLERLDESLHAEGLTGDSSELLAKVLRMPQTPVRAGRTEAIIELAYQPHQVFDLAYRFLAAARTPKSIEQIIRELRKQTRLSWNQISRLLVLERDPRFVQYQGDNRWYLTEWKLINDEVYAYVQTHQIERIPLRTIPYMLEQGMGLTGKSYIFIPELDDRFRIEEDMLYFPLSNEEESQPADTGEAEVEQAKQETAAAAVQEEETLVNTTHTSVLEEVQQLLQRATSLLERRNEEMAREVIVHFQQSNMQAIEILMNEKHKNEQAAHGIAQVLAGLEQR
ncbi:hypothetical protein [Brevibacillus massiliensis]|uniref:hypothetical protein n=1 Tax=Brevibacillus massiliensis TaxID=1118054 RepID=UPI0002E04F91|nr:hypothetical protein [Brevibacillus massiliensis]